VIRLILLFFILSSCSHIITRGELPIVETPKVNKKKRLRVRIYNKYQLIVRKGIFDSEKVIKFTSLGKDEFFEKRMLKTLKEMDIFSEIKTDELVFPDKKSIKFEENESENEKVVKFLEPKDINWEEFDIFMDLYLYKSGHGNPHPHPFNFLSVVWGLSSIFSLGLIPFWMPNDVDMRVIVWKRGESGDLVKSEYGRSDSSGVWYWSPLIFSSKAVLPFSKNYLFDVSWFERNVVNHLLGGVLE